MPGVPRRLAEHTLNVDPKYKPVKQFLRRFNEERRKAIGEEVARLLAAGFIIEVFHPEWLANPVLVLKKNGTWRMCVDYTDLNKACPADPFALPRIDQIIDATAGCERLSFLDAYSGYHQIKMAVKDQEKTAFITPFGAFCYLSMHFGLKSAQATYQRCVQNCLHNQIGRNVHAYVDDIVVKSREAETLISDLRETFDNLRVYNMMLCRVVGATYANGWLICVGASKTSPVPGSGIRRRHARRRILPSFGALRGDNTPTAALRGLRMITR